MIATLSQRNEPPVTNNTKGFREKQEAATLNIRSNSMDAKTSLATTINLLTQFQAVQAGNIFIEKLFRLSVLSAK